MWIVFVSSIQMGPVILVIVEILAPSVVTGGIVAQIT